MNLQLFTQQLTQGKASYRLFHLSAMIRSVSLVSIIAMIVSPNVLTTVSSQGLRSSVVKTKRDHFSNDDLTINSPIV